jgi:hypothetical protein
MKILHKILDSTLLINIVLLLKNSKSFSKEAAGENSAKHGEITMPMMIPARRQPITCLNTLLVGRENHLLNAESLLSIILKGCLNLLNINNLVQQFNQPDLVNSAGYP